MKRKNEGMPNVFGQCKLSQIHVNERFTQVSEPEALMSLSAPSLHSFTLFGI